MIAPTPDAADYRYRLAPAAWDLWRVPAHGRTWDWICEHVKDKDGQPFAPELYPWLEGVADAFDDPTVRMLALQWASRIGKTFIFEAIALSVWARTPMPSMFVSATKQLAHNTIREEFEPMIERCEPLAGQLKPPSRRSKSRIDLARCACRVGWAASPATMAGYAAWWAHLNEVDKYPIYDLEEGDPLEQALERVEKQFPDFKAGLESTPGTAVHTRIARVVRASNNCRYWVPCPKCRAYQTLQCTTGHPKDRGLIWEGLDAGDAGDAELAAATARYLCRHCPKEIDDEERQQMMIAGRWVPDGQHVDRRGRLLGAPRQPGRVWGGQLSSLYALTLTWGDYARKKVTSQRRPSTRKTFTQQWEGLPFSPSASKTEPEQLGDLLEVDVPRGVVPRWAAFLITTVDYQDWGLVWQTCAWGPRECGHLVDHGEVDSWDEVRSQISKSYACEGSGRMGTALAMIDSGFKTDEVYKKCRAFSREGIPVLACCGEKMNLRGRPFKKEILGQTRRRKARAAALRARGQILIHCAIDYWESVLQDYFEERRPGQAASLSLYRGAGADLDLCRQLLNAERSERLNQRNRSEFLWVKKWEEQPNDCRDLLRYNRCGAELFARGRWERRGGRAERSETPASVPTRKKSKRFVRELPRGRRGKGGRR